MGIPRMLHAKMLGLYFSFGALPDFSRCHDLAMIWQLVRNSIQITYLEFVLTDKYGLSR